MAPLQTVHLRVNDIATGKPTPCRLRVTDAAGVYYAPLGRLPRFATGINQDVGGNVQIDGFPHAYIDGACEINLPPGRLHIEINKGPEFTPLHQDVELLPGKLSLRFGLERWINLPSRGWYSGDARVHFLTPHAALLEAQAEDVHVVNLLATEMGSQTLADQASCISNILAFSGQEPALAAPGYLVAVNSFNAHPKLGSLALLNCHRPIYPLRFGDTHGPDHWTLADWCDQCHRKNGLVVWARTCHDDPASLYGETLADVILGKIDAFELGQPNASRVNRLNLWYELLNDGFHLPLVGASGKDSNGSPLGEYRTFAKLDSEKEFNYKEWIHAIRQGRTILTNGPLLFLEVDGQEPGGQVTVGQPEAPVRVQIICRGLVPWAKIQVMVNGVIAAVLLNKDRVTSLEWSLELPIDQDCWVAARCLDEEDGEYSKPGQFAHTSPVYIKFRTGTIPRSRGEGLDQKLLGELAAMQMWAREQANCETPRQRERLVNLFQQAQDELQRRLGCATASVPNPG